MDKLAQQRLHAVIEGEVQGVGFRFFVQDNARNIGLSGWVRNRWDGTVEVLAEGEKEKLDRLFTKLQKGPRSSRVTGISPDWQKASGEYTGFQVRMTAH